jgi:threonine dehydrogenase-like Zn-dependent dehydrogenase
MLVPISPNLDLRDQHGPSAEVLGCLRPNLRETTATRSASTRGTPPSVSTARLAHRVRLKARALARGIQVIDLREHEDDLPEVVRELSDGRGPDSVIDAVSVEAHGFAWRGFRPARHALPDALAKPEEGRSRCR